MTIKGNHRQYELDPPSTLPQIRRLLVNLSNVQSSQAAVVGVASERFGEDIGWVLVTANEVKAHFVVRDEFANVVVTDIDMLDLCVQLGRLHQVNQSLVIAPHVPQLLLR